MSQKKIAYLDSLPQYPAWVEVVKTYAKCHKLLAKRLGSLELSVAQHEVLLAVMRDEGLSQQELARRLLVVKSNVTVLLQRLTARGLIRREADKDDRRGRKVYLTAAGQRLVTQSARLQAEVVRLMTLGLRGNQVEQLRGIMRQAGASLDEALAE